MTALFAIVASIFIGASDVAGGVASRTRDSASMTALMHLIALPLLIVAAVSRGAPDVHVSDLGASAVSGALTGMAYIWFFAALAKGSVAIVVPITASTAVITPVVVAVIGGERPSALAWIGVLGCLVAVPLCGMGEQNSELEAEVRTQWSPLRQSVVAATTGVGFGSFYAVMGHTSSTSGTWPTVVVVTVAGLVTAAVSLGRERSAPTSSPPFGGRPDGATAIAGGGLAFGDILNTLALQRGPLTTTAVLGNLYPLVAVVIARVVLSERFTTAQASGLALGVAGAGCISLG